MTQSNLIELTYFDPKFEVRLTAYADTIIMDKDGNSKIISAIRFGGYPEMVRGLSDAIYGGGTIDAIQNGVTLSLHSRPKAYASRTEAQILYKEEFDRLSQDGRITVVYVLSDEDKEGFERGPIDAALIRKYAPESEPYSVFACLSPSMCRDVDKEIAKLGLERKYVRHEILRELLNASSAEDYPGAGQTEVKITVTIRDVTKTVTGSANDTILRTLEKNGIVVPTSCRSGECGFCHSTLVSGNVYVPKNMDGRHFADLKFNHIHPCVTFPLSDIEIIVPADQ